MVKNKRFSLILVLLVIVLLITGLIGCEIPDTSDKSDQQVEMKSIIFDTNGGSSIEPLKNKIGTQVIAPTKPLKAGYTFVGWYKDNETFSEEYSFTTIPEEDITIYAKWQINKYTIVFECNGGSEIDPIEQEYNSTIVMPENPTKEGFEFKGWYEDQEFKTPFELDKMPVDGKVIYAKWEMVVHEHTYGDWEVTSTPSKEATGVIKRSCSICHESETKTLPMLNPNDYTVSVKKEASCSEEGTEVYTYKKITTLKFEVAIPKLSHTYGDFAVTLKPTMNGTGTAERICSECNSVDKLTLPSLSQTKSYLKTTIQKLSCLQDGIDEYILKDNQKIKFQIVTPKLPHSMTAWNITIIPTDVNVGKAVRECQNEGCNYKEEENLPVLDATSYNIERVEPTCKKDGSITYKLKKNTNIKVVQTLTKLGHDWNRWEVVGELVEGNKVTVKYFCSRCNDTKLLDLPTLNKSNYVYKLVKEPGCETTGLETYTTTFEEKEYVLNKEIPATGHTFSKWEVVGTPKVGETCQVKRHCTVEGCLYEETKDLPVLNSTNYTVIGGNPTCTEGADREYRFKENPSIVINVHMDALGHDYVEYVNDEERGKKCSRCDSKIEVVKHVYSDWVVETIPTATLVGLAKKTCQNVGCGHEVTQTLPILNLNNYTITKVIKASTCTATGRGVYQLNNSTISFEADIAMKDHAYGEWEIRVVPEDNKFGEAVKTCPVCGKEVTEGLPMLISDAYEVTIVDPTCTEDGYHKYVLKKDRTINFKIISKKLGHDTTNRPWAVTVEPTSGKPGEARNVCKRCNHEISMTIPVINETNYVIIVTPATCSSKGETEYQLREGILEGDPTVIFKTYTDMLPHTPGEWEVGQAPTIESDGYLIKKCQVCGQEVETKYLAPLSDASNYTYVENLAPTCTAEGSGTYTYKKDNNFTFDVVLAKLPHNLEMKHDTTNHWNECSVCHNKFDIEKHNSVETIEPATYLKNAEKVYKCSVCNYEISRETINDSILDLTTLFNKNKNKIVNEGYNIYSFETVPNTVVKGTFDNVFDQLKSTCHSYKTEILTKFIDGEETIVMIAGQDEVIAEIARSYQTEVILNNFVILPNYNYEAYPHYIIGDYTEDNGLIYNLDKTIVLDALRETTLNITDQLLNINESIFVRGLLSEITVNGQASGETTYYRLVDGTSLYAGPDFRIKYVLKNTRIESVNVHDYPEGFAKSVEWIIINDQLSYSNDSIKIYSERTLDQVFVPDSHYIYSETDPSIIADRKGVSRFWHYDAYGKPVDWAIENVFGEYIIDVQEQDGLSGIKHRISDKYLLGDFDIINPSGAPAVAKELYSESDPTNTIEFKQVLESVLLKLKNAKALTFTYKFLGTTDSFVVQVQNPRLMATTVYGYGDPMQSIIKVYSDKYSYILNGFNCYEMKNYPYGKSVNDYNFITEALAQSKLEIYLANEGVYSNGIYDSTNYSIALSKNAIALTYKQYGIEVIIDNLDGYSQIIEMSEYLQKTRARYKITIDNVAELNVLEEDVSYFEGEGFYGLSSGNRDGIDIKWYIDAQHQEEFNRSNYSKYPQDITLYGVLQYKYYNVNLYLDGKFKETLSYREKSTLDLYDITDTLENITWYTSPNYDQQFVRASFEQNPKNITLYGIVAHNYGEWQIDRKPTYVLTGIASRQCTTGGCTHVEEIVLPVLSNEFYDVELNPATCGNAGSRRYTYQAERSIVIVEELDALEHKYVNKNDETNHWQECVHCHERINVAAHTPVEEVIEASYTSNKVTYTRCSHCGYEISRVESPDTILNLKHYYDLHSNLLTSDYFLGKVTDCEVSSFMGATQRIKQLLNNFAHEVLYRREGKKTIPVIIGAENRVKATLETILSDNNIQYDVVGNFYVLEREEVLHKVIENVKEVDNISQTKDGKLLFNITAPLTLNITNNIKYVADDIFKSNNLTNVTINGAAEGTTSYFKIANKIVYVVKGAQSTAKYVLANTKLNAQDSVATVYYNASVEWIIVEGIHNVDPNYPAIKVYSTRTLDAADLIDVNRDVYLFSDVDPSTIVDTKQRARFWKYAADGVTPEVWTNKYEYGAPVVDFEAKDGYDGMQHKVDSQYAAIMFERIAGTGANVAVDFYTTEISDTTYSQALSEILNNLNLAKSFEIKEEVAGAINTINYLPYMIVYRSNKKPGCYDITYLGKDNIFGITYNDQGAMYCIKNYPTGLNQETYNAKLIETFLNKDIGGYSIKEVLTNPGISYNQGTITSATAKYSYTINATKQQVKFVSSKRTVTISKLNGYVEIPTIPTVAFKTLARYNISLNTTGDIDYRDIIYIEGQQSIQLPTFTNDFETIVWYLDKEQHQLYEEANYLVSPYDVTLYGLVLQKIPNPTITLMSNGQVAQTLEYVVGEILTLPEILDGGVRVVGWYLDDQFIEAFDKEAYYKNPVELTLYAKLEVRYKITMNDLNQTFTITTNPDASFVVPEKSKNGKCVVWYLDENKSNPFVLSDYLLNPSDITLYAKEYHESEEAWVVGTQPTTVATGEMSRYCTVCGLYETVTLPVLSDVDYDIVVVAEPTCTGKGAKTYTYKANKDIVFTVYENALGHNFDQWQIKKAPTTDMYGEITRTCKVCGKVEEAFIPMLNNTDYIIFNDEPATCTQVGHRTYYNQEYNFGFEVEMPMLEHKMGAWVVEVQPTANTEGQIVRTCATCPHNETKVIPVLNEDNYIREVLTIASCTTRGRIQYTCKYEEASFIIETEQLQHKYGKWDITVEPTKESTGSAVSECSICHTVTEIVLPALNDIDYSKVVITEAGCNTAGSEQYTYLKDESIVINYTVQPLGHSFTNWNIVQAPTYENIGLIARGCTRCDKSETEEIPVLNPEFYDIQVIKDPTCTEEGEAIFILKAHKEIKITVKAPPQHDYDAWVVNTLPTMETVGSASRMCMACKEVEEVELPILTSEVYEVTVVSDPTPEQPGITSYKYIAKDITFEVEVAYVPPHVVNSWTVTVLPTQQTPGKAEGVCENCNKTIVQELPIITPEYYYLQPTDGVSCGIEGVYSCMFKENADIMFHATITLEHNLVKDYNKKHHYDECQNCHEIFNKEKHTFTVEKISGNRVRKTCSVCGYTKETIEYPQVPVSGLPALWAQNQHLLTSKYDYKIGDIYEENMGYFSEPAIENLLLEVPHNILFKKEKYDDVWSVAIIEVGINMYNYDITRKMYYNGNYFLFDYDEPSHYKFINDAVTIGDTTYNKDKTLIIDVVENGVMDILPSVAAIGKDVLTHKNPNSVTFNGQETGHNNMYTVTDSCLLSERKPGFVEYVYKNVNLIDKDCMIGIISKNVEYVIVKADTHVSTNFVTKELYYETLEQYGDNHWNYYTYLYSETDPNTFVENKFMNHFWHFDVDGVTPLYWTINKNFGEFVIDHEPNNGYDGYKQKSTPSPYEYRVFDRIPATTKAVEEKLYDPDLITKDNYLTVLSQILEKMQNMKSGKIVINLLNGGPEDMYTINMLVLPYMFEVRALGDSDTIYYGNGYCYSLNNINYHKFKVADWETYRYEHIQSDIIEGSMFDILEFPEFRFVSNTQFEFDDGYQKFEIFLRDNNVVIEMYTEGKIEGRATYSNYNGYIEAPVFKQGLDEEGFYRVAHTYRVKTIVEGSGEQFISYTEKKEDYFKRLLKDKENDIHKKIIWYLDNQYTIPFDINEYFMNPVDVTIYGKLGEVIPPPEIQIYLDGKFLQTVSNYDMSEMHNQLANISDMNRTTYRYFRDDLYNQEFELSELHVEGTEIPKKLYALTAQAFNVNFIIKENGQNVYQSQNQIYTHDFMIYYPKYANKNGEQYYIEPVWYTDEGCTKAFDLNEYKRTLGEITLYGKFTQNIVPQYNIELVVKGESYFYTYNVEEYFFMDNVYNNNHRIEGYYLDEQMQNKVSYDEYKNNPRDIKLYVKLLPISTITINFMLNGEIIKVIEFLNNKSIYDANRLFPDRHNGIAIDSTYYVNEELTQKFNQKEYDKNPHDITLYCKPYSQAYGNKITIKDLQGNILDVVETYSINSLSICAEYFGRPVAYYLDALQQNPVNQDYEFTQDCDIYVQFDQQYETHLYVKKSGVNEYDDYRIYRDGQSDTLPSLDEQGNKIVYYLDKEKTKEFNYDRDINIGRDLILYV